MARKSMMERAIALPMLASCPPCPWFKDCRGYRDGLHLFGDTCFARCCCGGQASCDYLCPKNLRFVTMMNEAEGLRFDRLPELVHRAVELPAYVPSVLHDSNREEPLNVPFAAVPVERVFRTHGRGRHARLKVVANSPQGLRAALSLGLHTRIVLNCIRQDKHLERLWEYWRRDAIPEQLAALQIELVIGPNFSHLRGVPRLESVGNRMRHLICVRDIAKAGLVAVPHLSVVDPSDWEWWKSYIATNPRVKYVAFEFETGYKDPVEGEDAISRLADLQAHCGHDLHMLVIGGTQYRQSILKHFRAYTFIDAMPFYATMIRHRAVLEGDGVSWEPAPSGGGEMLDTLMRSNVGVYGNWFLRDLGLDFGDRL
jgi:hypothetical protein